MAQVLHGGTMMFDALAYGQPHPGTQQFLQMQFEAPTRYLTEAGERFFAGAQELYERISGSTADRMMRAAGRAIRSMWQLDEIRPLRTVEDFQHAPLSMQRYLMAEPLVRERFQQQRLDGYSESYVDVFPNAIGEDHYDYRRVMNGMVVVNEDPDGDGSWQATTYMEELLPDDNELHLEDQIDLMDAWKFMRQHLLAGREDPTSRFNADLG